MFSFNGPSELLLVVNNFFEDVGGIVVKFDNLICEIIIIYIRSHPEPYTKPWAGQFLRGARQVLKNLCRDGLFLSGQHRTNKNWSARRSGVEIAMLQDIGWTVVPEAAFYAQLFGLLTLAGAVWLRRRARH